MKKPKELTVLDLDDSFRVVFESQNWSLEKLSEVIDIKTKQATGEKKWKNVGYFSINLNHTLKRYVTEALTEEGKVKAEDILHKLNEISKQIDKVVKKENLNTISKELLKNE